MAGHGAGEAASSKPLHLQRTVYGILVSKCSFSYTSRPCPGLARVSCPTYRGACSRLAGMASQWLAKRSAHDGIHTDFSTFQLTS